MKTEWDYTHLADAYLKRPDYSENAINEMLETASVKKEDKVCDVGAGVAHLTIMLAERGLEVKSIEPNDAMRSNGIRRTKGFKNVTWHEGTGEETGQSDNEFELVTFGSSFNVTDRSAALLETSRILKPGGWFACMWNHRDLDDEIQTTIENIIKKNITHYDYGSRREDQTDIINKSNLFNDVIKIEGKVFHEQSIVDCIEAWRSHGTLHRQAGDSFETIIYEIEKYLNSLGVEKINIPYTSRIWLAQLK